MKSYLELDAELIRVKLICVLAHAIVDGPNDDSLQGDGVGLSFYY